MGSIIRRGYEALRADRSLVGSALVAMCAERAWDETKLAAWLGIDPEWLPVLGLCRRPDPNEADFEDQVAALAQFSGCDGARLRALLVRAW